MKFDFQIAPTKEELKIFLEDFGFEKIENNPTILQKSIQNLFLFKDVDVNNSDSEDFRNWFNCYINELKDFYFDPSWTKKMGIRNSKIFLNGYFWNDILSLIIAYNMQFSSLYNSIELKKLINQMVEHGNNLLKKGAIFNWWAIDLNIIQQVLKILIIEKDILKKNLKKSLLVWSITQGFHPNHIGYRPNKMDKGMNKLWIGYNCFLQGILLDNQQFINQAITIFEEVSQFTESLIGNGIMKDGSYHFHGNQVNMGYGVSFLEVGSLVWYILSKMDNYKPPIEIIETWNKFLEFNYWMCHKGKYNFYNKGRAASRALSKHKGGGVCDNLDFLRPLLISKFESLKFIVEKTFKTRFDSDKHKIFIPLVETFYFSMKTRDLKMEKLEESQNKSQNGVRMYPTSRMLVSRGENHYIGLQMSDKFNRSWFSIWRENSLGNQVGEGSILYMTDGSEHTLETQFANLWRDMMGVTYVGKKVRFKNKKGGGKCISLGNLNNSGNFGNAGMIYSLGTLTCKKSFHIYNDLLFMIGSEINCSTAKKIIQPKDIVKTSLFTEPTVINPSFGEDFCVDNENLNCQKIIDEQILFDKHRLRIYHNESKDTEFFLGRTIKSIDPKKVNAFYAPDIDIVKAGYLCAYAEHGKFPKSAQFCFAVRIGSTIEIEDFKIKIDKTGHCITLNDDFASGIYFKSGTLPSGYLSEAGTIIWHKNIKNNTLELFIGINITDHIKDYNVEPKIVTFSLPVSTKKFKNNEKVEIEVDSVFGKHITYNLK